MEALLNLPSRGTLTQNATVTRAPKAYVATNDTAPPPGQLIANDTSPYITSIWKRQDNSKAAQAQQKAAAPKRPSGIATAPPAKRQNVAGTAVPASVAGSQPLAAAAAAAAATAANGAGPSGAGAGTSGAAAAAAAAPAAAARRAAAVEYSQDELQRKTNKDLSDILKARGLPHTGKKEMLIARIVEQQRRQRRVAQPS